MFANWLNTAFAGLDGGTFNFVHNLANKCGGFLTPILKFVTMLGNDGWAFIVLGIILLLFRKTRKAGFTVLFAILVGFILTNVLLKNLIDRARPYVADEKYRDFWQVVNGVKESEKSFPSGHATVSTAAMMALFLSYNKKWSWLFFFVAALMGFTRIYIVVHYLTDVIAGFIVGALSGVLGAVIRNAVYKLFEKNQQNKVVNFIMDFDIIGVFKK